MKKILITGINSYVGNRFAEWVEQYPKNYYIDKVSVRDDKWKELDLSIYDTVLHVAGIAHRKETKENKGFYYEVNRDLAKEVALKARNDGVKQFIFLSTMSVYGLDKGVIYKDTPLNPKNNYGKSKLQAEEILEDLENSSFKIAIVRPPMIYGKGCKGNYQLLRKAVLKTPIFPKIINARSMIYVDNLSEFMRTLIDNSAQGIFNPQNKEYVSTSDLARLINKVHGKKIIFTKIFNPLVTLFNIQILSKVFGDLVYDEEFFQTNSDSWYSLEESIKLTEMQEKES